MRPLIVRVYDCSGTCLGPEELKRMEITTPVMEHIFATVADRLRPEESCPNPLPPVETPG